MGALATTKEILSFSSTYRPYTLATLLLALAIIPVAFFEWLAKFSACNRILGEYCYSFGITRGISTLLKGNIQQAIEYNILTIPIVILLLIIIVRDVQKKFI